MMLELVKFNGGGEKYLIANIYICNVISGFLIFSYSSQWQIATMFNYLCSKV